MEEAQEGRPEATGLEPLQDLCSEPKEASSDPALDKGWWETEARRSGQAEARVIRKERRRDGLHPMGSLHLLGSPRGRTDDVKGASQLRAGGKDLQAAPHPSHSQGTWSLGDSGTESGGLGTKRSSESGEDFQLEVQGAVRVEWDL